MKKVIAKDEKFAQVRRFLWHSSPDVKVLSDDEHRRVMCACDGFGKMTWAQLTELGLTWDYSHVRDSSDAAIEGAYEVLVQVIREGHADLLDSVMSPVLKAIQVENQRKTFRNVVKALRIDPAFAGRDFRVSYTKMTVTVRASYFYRHGDCDTWATKVSEQMAKHGLKLLDSGDNWNAWPKLSFFEARFTL